MRNKLINIIKLISLPAGYFHILLAGIFFLSSCQNDNIPGNPDDNGNTDDGEAYISILIKTGKNSETDTRMIPSLDEDWGLKEEQSVSKVRMVLYEYGTVDPVVRYVFDYNIRSTDNGDEVTGYEQYLVNGEYQGAPYEDPDLYLSHSKSEFTTFARKVKLDNYQMLLIINPTEPDDSDGINRDHLNLYKLTETGRTYSELYNAVTIAEENIRNRAKGGIAEDNYFLMTNHQELVFIDKNELILKESKQIANNNPFPVEVSRAVGKITVRAAGTGDNPALTVLPTGAQVENFLWKPDISNKQTYWFRHMTGVLREDGSVGPQELVWKETAEGQSGDARKYAYAQDPNFAGMTDYTPDQLTPHFNYFPQGQLITAGNGGININRYDYCLENTMTTDNQVDKLITRVLMQCNYIPRGMQQGESYFVFNDYIISCDRIQYFQSSSAIIPDYLGGITEAIANVENETSYDLSDPSSISESFVLHGLRFYKDGINYYTAKIKHTGNPGYGEYGVVRNNHYVVTVNEILGPGWPTIDFQERGNISIEISLLNWQDRDHGIILK